MFWNRISPIAQRDTLDSRFDLLDRFFGHSVAHAPSHTTPAFNIWADEDGAVVSSELPGVALEDVEITVSGNSLSVKGARKDEESAENSRHIRRERVHGAFERSFRLGFQIDAANVQAKLTDGVLEINLPRAENDKPRKISIAVS